MDPVGAGWCRGMAAAFVLVALACGAAKKQCRCARTDGELTRLQIQRVVRSSYGRMRACYREGLRTRTESFVGPSWLES